MFRLGKSNRQTTRDRFETSYQKRERAQNYAKSSIPKPRVVARLNDSKTQSQNATKVSVKKPHIKRTSNIQPKVQSSKKEAVPEKKDEELDNLLDYMLERHRSEQNKLKSMS